MIVSASRRTDIPAFYGPWFERRIREGFALAVNPRNPEQVRRVPLTPQDVDLIVFWTKHPAPFFRCLNLLDERGFRHLFMYTLNDYPQALEPRLPPLCERVATFRRLAERLGPRRVVWRYDPVIISERTPPEYHAEAFGRLARALRGSTLRVAVSLLAVYRRNGGRLEQLARQHGMRCEDVRGEHELVGSTARALAQAARENGMAIHACAESANLAPYGIPAGACIDGELASEVAGRPVIGGRDGGQRTLCRCVPSVDIGAYDTCRFGCAYCYATTSEQAVAATVARHDPGSPALVGHPDVPPERPRQFRLPL
ncbi:DNA repair photolyase [Desulfobaculum xiamenense]|uniref:DNA repair photolyase n=1 Tax=Desulfobaculum xiamenense TaxID=995050 RepID=A0A846QJ71_9BACT|nr:DNA repair photolyase [Desulfobaculum xiamenense]